MKRRVPRRDLWMAVVRREKRSTVERIVLPGLGRSEGWKVVRSLWFRDLEKWE
jgi:hypothetical protein